MKPRDRIKQKGRRESGTFSLIPHSVQDSANWKSCSGTAIKLLLDLVRQLNGKNNGDLSAAMRIMRPRGWTRDETVCIALKELRHYGLLELTRQGGLNIPNLYALSWLAIDECKGKLDVPSTRLPSGAWKEQRARFRRPTKKSPLREAEHTFQSQPPVSGGEPTFSTTEIGAISAN